MKRFIILFLTALFTLTGCTTKSESQQPQVAETDISESETVTVPTPVTSAQEQAFELSVDTSSDITITLLDNPDFSLNLILYKDLEIGNTNYLYEVTKKNKNTELPKIYLTDMMVNDTDYISDFNGLYLDDEGETFSFSASNLKDYLAYNDYNTITSLSGHINVSKDYTSTDVYDFSVDIPQLGAYQFYFSPYLDAQAGTQTLVSNDLMDVSLIGCGNFSRFSKDEKLMGILRVSNKTDEAIPFNTQSVIVNGYAFNKNAGTTIEPHMTEFIPFTISASDFKTAGISSISSLSLLMLTDISDNSAIEGRALRGGSVFDVTLDKHGNAKPFTPEGKIIYDENNITVYLNLTSISSEEAGFKLYIDNHGDIPLSFSTDNEKCDGQNLNYSHGILYTADTSRIDTKPLFNTIPPGSILERPLYFDKLPDSFSESSVLSAKLLFYSAGGGDIIAESNEINIYN